jgi:hypothetical protein
MSYQKYKETIKSTNEARRDAVRVLIDNHREEFDAIYLEKARARGLNPTKIASAVKKVALAKKSKEEFDRAVEEKVAELTSSISREELSELL